MKALMLVMSVASCSDGEDIGRKLSSFTSPYAEEGGLSLLGQVAAAVLGSGGSFSCTPKPTI